MFIVAISDAGMEIPEQPEDEQDVISVSHPELAVSVEPPEGVYSGQPRVSETS